VVGCRTTLTAQFWCGAFPAAIRLPYLPVNPVLESVLGERAVPDLDHLSAGLRKAKGRYCRCVSPISVRAGNRRCLYTAEIAGAMVQDGVIHEEAAQRAATPEFSW